MVTRFVRLPSKGQTLTLSCASVAVQELHELLDEHQLEGDEGGAEEEIRRVAAEDVEDLAGGQLGVGCVHRSE